MLSFSVFSFLLLNLSTATPAPTSSDVDNASTPALPPLVGYVSGPGGRGTVSIIISCLLTLLLCVWQALHLNVPRPHETAAQCVLMNVRWIFTGVFAPELVVFTAWRQWCSARLLGKLIKELHRGEKEHNITRELHRERQDCKESLVNPNLAVAIETVETSIHCSLEPQARMDYHS